MNLLFFVLGRVSLMSVMNANDFASTQQRSEVIAVLGRDGMTIALREIYKRDAASFAQNGDYASALKAAHLTDEDFLTQIGDRFVSTSSSLLVL